MSDQMLEQILKEIGETRRDIAGMNVELAKNTTETQAQGKRLDTLNGTVARHERENIAFSGAITALQAFQKAQETKEDKTGTRKNDYVDWIVKGIVVLILLLLYKVLVTTGIVQNFLN